MRYLLVAVILIAVLPVPAYAELDRAAVAGLAFDPRPGTQLPPELQFRDENGNPVMLGDYFGTRPVVLSLNYFHCQYLCPIEEDGLISAFNGIGPSLGSDFTLLTVSIDPRDGPADAAIVKARGLRGYNRPSGDSGWHLLTSDQFTIDRLAHAVGFAAIHDPQAGDFAHAIGAIVLTPQGVITHYLEGIEFDSGEIQSALNDSGTSAVLGTVLVCYHFDPLTGRYTELALNALRIGGAVTVIGMLVFLLKLARSP